MDDIRISTGLLHHFKIHKLKKIIGPEAVERLLQLWIFTAVNKPSGELTDMDVIDIETAAGWNGDNGKFLEALKTCKLIDSDICGFSIHDWISNQGWVAGSTERSEKGRMATLKQNYPDIYKKLAAQGVTRITPEEYFRVTQGIPKGDPMGTQGFCSAPSPSPSPSPSPLPIPEKENNSCPADAVRVPEKPSRKAPAIYDVEFDTWWMAYPRHENKQKAAKAWDKIKDRPDLETLLTALDRQCRSEQWMSDGGKFIPHPTTYLNGRRWEDEGVKNPKHGDPNRYVRTAWGEYIDGAEYDGLYNTGSMDDKIDTSYGPMTRAELIQLKEQVWNSLDEKTKQWEINRYKDLAEGE